MTHASCFTSAPSIQKQQLHESTEIGSHLLLTAANQDIMGVSCRIFRGIEKVVLTRHIQDAHPVEASEPLLHLEELLGHTTKAAQVPRHVRFARVSPLHI